MRDAKNIIGLGLLIALINLILMFGKLIVGTIGNSYALVADGIESASDVVVSLITWIGYHMSLRPADAKHPFGHGRIESLAGMFSGLALLGAAGFIAFQSIKEIITPSQAPEWYTLPVLLLIVVVKELLSRRILNLADKEDSRALEGDAWHHRSDAITSAAAAVGIAIALLGDERFVSADDWAALFACGIIAFNGSRIIRSSLDENLDRKVGPEITTAIQTEAGLESGVQAIEKCVARKSGVYYFVELHVQVDRLMTVEQGHRIGHDVKERLLQKFPKIMDIVVHLEPYSE